MNISFTEEGNTDQKDPKNNDADVIHIGGVLSSRQQMARTESISLRIQRLTIEEPISSFVPNFSCCPEWAKSLMYSQYQEEYPEKWLCSILANLPDDLSKALRGAVFCTMICYMHDMQHAKQTMNTWPPGLSNGNSQHSSEPWLFDFDHPAFDELSVFDRSQLGVCRETFDPSTRRRTEHYVNPAFCRMAGMHAEEWLDRVRHAELPVMTMTTQLDHLCSIVEDLHHFLDVQSVRIARWSWPGKPAILVERQIQQVFDRSGRNWRRLTYYREITPSAYDSRCAAADAQIARHAGVGEQKPGRAPSSSLRRAIGDLRSGAELLADAAGDLQRQSIEGLSATPCGRATLSRLAEEIRQRFDGKIRAARRMLDESPELLAWARVQVEAPWVAAGGLGQNQGCELEGIPVPVE